MCRLSILAAELPFPGTGDQTLGIVCEILVCVSSEAYSALRIPYCAFPILNHRWNSFRERKLPQVILSRGILEPPEHLSPAKKWSKQNFLRCSWRLDMSFHDVWQLAVLLRDRSCPSAFAAIATCGFHGWLLDFGSESRCGRPVELVGKPVDNVAGRLK